MPATETADEEPEATPSAAIPQLPKGRRSFSRMRRELTDEETANPAVQKILLDDTERLESECALLRDYVDRFHLADKQLAIAGEKLKQQTAFDVFTGGALAVGSAMLGYVPNVWLQQPTGGICLALGVLLVAAGVSARWLAR